MRRDTKAGGGARTVAASAGGAAAAGSAAPGILRDTLAGYALRAGTAAALITDAVVHLQDAHFYDANTGALLSQGTLFRVQAVIAVFAALAVLVWPKWPSWAAATLVAATAAAAVVTYTYADIGPLAGLPSMYEPSWGPPGKLLSACAEGAGAALALAGLLRALAQRRRARRSSPGQAGQPAQHSPPAAPRPG
jgi:hypothetical protein